MIQPINGLPIDQVFHGDSLDVMRTFPDNSIDSLVCDPPAGIAFMGKDFDSNRGGRDKWIAWLAEIMREALRVVKPGGHAFVWALPKTSHWTATALEDAGWEIREKHYHLFSTGFPKSLNVGHAIDRMQGNKREVIGEGPYSSRRPRHDTKVVSTYHDGVGDYGSSLITMPASPEAQQYDGWGSATKPAAEEWILCRKPLSESSIAANVLKWGTGGMNIDKCRVEGEPMTRPNGKPEAEGWNLHKRTEDWTNTKGRWPSNVTFSHSLFCIADACSEDCAVLALEKQSGVTKSTGGGGYHEAGHDTRNGIYGRYGARDLPKNVGKGDIGTASRFFHCFTPDVPFLYTAKSSRSERNSGIPKRVEGALFEEYGDGLMEREAGIKNASGRGFSESDPYREIKAANTHPCVKSLSLMKHLISMITPINGIVLDCFAGSGSTGVAAIAEGYHFVLIEREDTPEEPYVSIIRQRIAHALYQQKRGWTIDEEGA